MESDTIKEVEKTQLDNCENVKCEIREENETASSNSEKQPNDKKELGNDSTALENKDKICEEKSTDKIDDEKSTDTICIPQETTEDEETKGNSCIENQTPKVMDVDEELPEAFIPENSGAQNIAKVENEDASEKSVPAEDKTGEQKNAENVDDPVNSEQDKGYKECLNPSTDICPDKCSTEKPKEDDIGQEGNLPDDKKLITEEENNIKIVLDANPNASDFNKENAIVPMDVDEEENTALNQDIEENIVLAEETSKSPTCRQKESESTKIDDNSILLQLPEQEENKNDNLGEEKEDEKLINEDNKLINEDNKLINEEEKLMNEDEKLINEDEKLINEDEKLINEDEKLMNEIDKSGNEKEEADELVDEDEKLVNKDDKLMNENDQSANENDKLVDEDDKLMNKDDKLVDEDKLLNENDKLVDGDKLLNDFPAEDLRKSPLAIVSEEYNADCGNVDETCIEKDNIEKMEVDCMSTGKPDDVQKVEENMLKEMYDDEEKKLEDDIQKKETDSTDEVLGKENNVIKENIISVTEPEISLNTTNLEENQEQEKKPLPEKELKEEEEIRKNPESIEIKEESVQAESSTLRTSDETDTVYHGKECINYECEHKVKKFVRAPLFVLNFFKVPRKSNKIQFVCLDCYDTAILKYEDLCSSVVGVQPLLFENIPSRQDFVEILDSSDEESTEGGSSNKSEIIYDENIGDLLQNELDNSLSDILNRIEIENQVNWTKSILWNKLKALERDSNEIAANLKNLQKKADKMHTSLYQCPKIRIKELQPLDLNTGRPYSKNNESGVPPAGMLQYPPIEVDKQYYAVKNRPIASWSPCVVLEFVDIPGQPNTKFYKIKFHEMKFPIVKCTSGKHMAYVDPPTVRLLTGTRVIARFDASTLFRSKDKTTLNNKCSFYPGIIAEPLQPYNKYRYLIFFDDGYAQYVFHKDIRAVCEFSENIWEDIHPGSKEFIQSYLTQYSKNRPMVQVKKGQSMITESNGKWLYAKVVDVDASLVQMQFESENRTEWIYRGSTRLGPLYKEIQTNQPAQIPQQMHRRNMPYIRYMQNEDAATKKDSSNSANTVESTTNKGNNNSIGTSTTGEKRAVAKKSSTPRPQESVMQSNSQLPVKHMNNSTIFVEDDNRPKGKVVYYTAKKNLPPRMYIPHECSPRCLFAITHNLKSYSPLAKPLLSGWERQIFKSKWKKAVVYRGPCGRRLRSIEELHRYLRQTKNVLNVDNFDFDTQIHCLAEYVIERSIVQKPDLSEGAENMIIPCINYYDNTMPPVCKYSTQRIPTKGVHLNLDPSFLVGCDCEDDCKDKSKCSCWQLTLAGARFGNPNTPPENVGYHYKRLPEPVQTGIYECNVNCKCSSHCINRVAQQPLQMKLQVFKTSNRGWGLRCINDIPKGSFVCIYAGHLLTEQTANEKGGANFGDEYFAELDYIEVVERLKEGYESDVQEDNESDEDIEIPTRRDDSDEEFFTGASVTHNKNGSINTRLRARAGTKESSEDENGKMCSRKGSGEDDEDDEGRQVLNFEPSSALDSASTESVQTKYKSIRKYYGRNESCYIMDAKTTGNIGRYFNHSCSPNLFVQNVFVDTHDLRFPWVAFFSSTNIRAGTELTWNYNYEVGIVPGKVLYCECGAPNCRGRLL